MEAAMVLLTILLITIVFAVIGLAVYLLFKYSIVFIIAVCAGKLIDKIKK